MKARPEVERAKKSKFSQRKTKDIWEMQAEQIEAR